MIRSFCAGVALLAITGCVQTAPTETVPNRVVGLGFIEGQLNWRGVGQNDITYAIGIFEEGGQYVVCAAEQSQNSGFRRQVMGALQVTMNNSVIINSLAWAPHYSGTDGLNGKSAACRQSGFTVVDDPEFDVKLTKTRFRY